MGDAERPVAAASRPLLGWWCWPILVTVLFLVLQPLIGSGWALFPDSYRYAKQAEIVLGATPAAAHEAALEAFCHSRAQNYSFSGTWTPRPQPVSATSPTVTDCVAQYLADGDVTSTDPRYQAIFETRPGYPVLAAPFIAAFGIERGMWVLGFVIACAGGLLTFTLLRIAGLRGAAAAAGQAAFLVSPLGWWALQPLGEGLVTVCVLAAVAGILSVRRGGLRGGFAAVTVAWLALAFVRFSSLVLVAGALAVACAIIALWHDRRRPVPRRHLLIAAALSASAVALTMLAMPILGLPGASITLQDTFTQHFAQPLVPDPWWQLARLNGHFWLDWIVSPTESWPVLACSLAGIAVLFVWSRGLAWIALALWCVGIAHIAAHPLAREADRLGLLMWMPAAIGLAVAAHVVIARWRPDISPPVSAAADRGPDAAPDAVSGAVPGAVSGAVPHAARGEVESR